MIAHVLFAAFISLQIADVYTTWRVLSVSGREVNPVMAVAIRTFGLLPALLAIKAGVCALFWYAQPPVPALAACCAAYLIVVTHNWRQIGLTDGK